MGGVCVLLVDYSLAVPVRTLALFVCAVFRLFASVGHPHIAANVWHKVWHQTTAIHSHIIVRAIPAIPFSCKTFYTPIQQLCHTCIHLYYYNNIYINRYGRYGTSNSTAQPRHSLVPYLYTKGMALPHLTMAQPRNTPSPPFGRV